jgi:transcription initiation factor TFIIIB Brf1 subunit/transcription initiation factor TFIIB
MALEINIGEEYNIKIEKGEEFDESIFKDVYRQAAKCVEEIIVQSQKGSVPSISNDSYNNIIAFTGERGTGKSSSMISFAEALIDKKDDSHKTFFTKGKKKNKAYKNINETEIDSLDVIDPSLFKGDDKLFEIIISKMFSKFQKEITEGVLNISQDDKRKLIKHFQKVFNNLKVVHKGKSDVYDKEAIEALSDLAYGTNLKDNFGKLVDVFLKTIGKGSDFILIVIDDFDLNISGAHEMLEDIRQFLIQKNIILFIACKIEQLQDSVNQEIVQNFKTIINNDTIQNVYLSEEVNDKSERYLDKLLPIEKRISTPSFDLNNSSKDVLNIYGEDVDKDVYKGKSIEKTILELIYRKTKHIVTSNDFENIIIPSTLRNIANVATFIYREKNIEAYKRVLFKGINSDLKTDYINFFKEIENTPNKSLNQYIVNWIGSENNKRLENNESKRGFKRLLYPTVKNFKNREESVLYRHVYLITEASNNANVSYADVMLLVRRLEENGLFSDKDLFKLYSYIKLYYSLRISLSDKTELLQLVNGEMTNSELKFLRSEQGASDRHEFKIEYKPVDLFKLIEDRKSSFNFKENIQPTKEEIREETKEIYTTSKDELYFWLTFFFTHLGTPNSKYRNESEIQHKTIAKKIGSPYLTVTFNSLAFLHNTLSAKLVLKRFFPDDNLVKQTPLFAEIEAWNEELKEDSNYYNIFNFQLFDEFLIELYKKSIDKNLDSNGSFGTDLHNFIVNGLSEVIDVFKVKYPYLDLTPILDNPIIKYWNKNIDSVTALLDLIRNVKNQDETKEALKLAKSYINKIKRAQVHSTSLKTLINKLKKKDFKNKTHIINNLEKVYNALRDKNQINKHQGYLDELYNYLDNLGKLAA